MQCIDCQYSSAKGKAGEGYFFCEKKQEEVLPFNVCKMSKQFKDEQRAIDIYMDNYETKTLDEILKMIGKRSIDKAKLNYLITKHFLPRKLWGEEV